MKTVYLLIKKEVVYGYHGEDSFEEATPMGVYASKERAEEEAALYPNPSQKRGEYWWTPANKPWLEVQEMQVL